MAWPVDVTGAGAPLSIGERPATLRGGLVPLVPIDSGGEKSRSVARGGVLLEVGDGCEVPMPFELSRELRRAWSFVCLTASEKRRGGALPLTEAA